MDVSTGSTSSGSASSPEPAGPDSSGSRPTISEPIDAVPTGSGHVDSGRAEPDRIETLVIGGGQAGLAVGYHLSRRDLPFLIVDASERIGDAWRNRWDSLRLFTPARFNGLDGMPFPGDPDDFPTKDEMADYLEAYARRFGLPVRSGTRVRHLTRVGGRFQALTEKGAIEADNVVVAMSNYQRPRTPAFADGLRGDIRQIHSADYRSPDQLRPGPVLVVGAGNSGSEIAMELSSRHTVWMAGRDVGQIPFRPRGLASRLLLGRLVLRGVYHRVLTVANPLGRKVRSRVLHKSGPLVRVKYRDLARAGVERVPEVRGIEDGLPVLEDGRVMEPGNVVWCTGFGSALDWIDLPSQSGEPGADPSHESGIVPEEPGLYFVGRHFLHALSSAMIHGVGRDARRVAEAIAQRASKRSAAPSGPASMDADSVEVTSTVASIGAA